MDAAIDNAWTYYRKDGQNFALLELRDGRTCTMRGSRWRMESSSWYHSCSIGCVPAFIVVTIIKGG
jgi:hypothetical protein